MLLFLPSSRWVLVVHIVVMLIGCQFDSKHAWQSFVEPKVWAKWSLVLLHL